MHLLKYKYLPKKRNKSWLFTIYEHQKMASVETGLNMTIFLKKNTVKIDSVNSR